MVLPELLPELWTSLVWPLLRLLLFISIGLLVASFIESLNWTSKIAALARPLIRFGHLSETAGASFSMALFSGVTANTMLAEAYDKQTIGKKELVLSNLFNSLPTYFLHLPTMLVITTPLIKGAAFIYVGLTFGAAILRTFSITLLSRHLLAEKSAPATPVLGQEEQQRVDWKGVLKKGGIRFKKRIGKIVRYTIPIYILIFLMHRSGIFMTLELAMANYLSFLPWLTPQSMGIITLHIAAEFTAGLAAAGALLQEGSMTYQEIIMALLVGNILSSPIRAVRHQFPFYAGIFKPKLATELIIYNQLFRVGSLLIMGIVYFLVAT